MIKQMKANKIVWMLLFALATSLTVEAAKKPKLEKGLYVEMTTSKGVILIKLTPEKTPLTVANFVGLAEGKIKNDARPMGTPYYDSLKFHRVIANFMIQGGDPLGNGSGGPGYRFKDEFVDEYKFTGPGILAMANAGPATNGSQFFITHKETPWLNNKHTIFGFVVSGQNVVDTVQQGDYILKVKIIRIGKDAKKFKADKVFAELMNAK
jgi:peptidyl-prolyl cis-trans isomerase A (cyclophilin A)